MHELSVAESVVRILEEQSTQGNFKRVRKIRLEVGALSTIVVDSLTFCFDSVAQGTVAESAELEVTVVSGDATCKKCGHQFETREFALACPECHSYEVRVQGGQDLRIKDVEVE